MAKKAVPDELPQVSTFEVVNDEVEEKPLMRVADVIGDRPFGDVPLRYINDMWDEDIIIDDVVQRTGQFGGYVTILCERDNECFVVNCGGKVVMKKLLDCKERHAFPLVGSFHMHGNYIDIT